ncbi:RNA polymerase sigma factor, partial [Xanthovirga aplysinae]|uniref:RNA polymerase sigma factor n=1 Tax=Xanthovirga aplysinae TaxID=2529853 RepID=UPI0016575610
AIQDLFIEIRHSRERLSETTSIKYYLFKSIRRKILNKKKKTQSIFVSVEAFQGYDFAFSLSYEHKLVAQQLEEEKVCLLNKAIQKLTIRQREAIYYYFYEGLSYLEIMDLMEMENVKSVRNLIYKALNILRKYMPISAFVGLVLLRCQ